MRLPTVRRCFAWITCVAPTSAACDQPFERVTGCVESERPVNIGRDGLRVTGEAVDGAGFVASEPCPAFASHELFVADADGVRFRFASGASAGVVLDAQAFTFHAFSAATESFTHCEDGAEPFSWALMRDPT